jgi:hypothetical protein
VTLDYRVPGTAKEYIVHNNHEVSTEEALKLRLEQNLMRQRVAKKTTDILKKTGYNTKSSGYYNTSRTVDQALLKEAHNMVDDLVWTDTDDKYLTDLQKDFTGQIREAVSTQEYFTKWGYHYLLSIVNAHRQQLCNNFKDPGVQHYGGKLFNELADKLDAIFLKIPAPKPSAAQVATAMNMTKSVGGKKFKFKSSWGMSSYHTSSNPCFHGSCLILMSDGTHKRIDQIERGDRVITFKGESGRPDEIECIVKTKCTSGYAEITSLPKGLKITPWHPIIHNGAWRFPNDVSKAELVPCDYVYNIITKSRDSVMINDTICCTLGHGMKGDVIGHNYFGSDAVVNDLSRMSGWKDGLVVMNDYTVTRDTITGHVNKMGNTISVC